MGSPAEQIRQDLEADRRRLQQNAGEAAALIQAELRAALGTPYPPASRPGQIPHLRSGALQASAYATAASAPGRITITVGATAPHAEAVSRLRPFIEPTMERIGSAVEETLFKGL
jgi:hypothetical protein